MKTISSSMTFTYKYVFPILWNGLFGIGSIAMIIQDSEDKWVFLSLWIMGSIFIFFCYGSIKKIEFDGENFHVSSYLKSETIHKSNVTSVSASIFLAPEFVWFKLNKNSSFGKKIIFIPKFRFPMGFSYNPIAKELRVLCGL